MRIFTLVAMMAFVGAACTTPANPPAQDVATLALPTGQYAEFALDTSLADVSANDQKMLQHLLRAAEVMDGLFWRQAYGDDYLPWLATLDEQTVQLATINYGPWDRLDNDAPFVAGAGAKVKGARFYPADMTDAEFDAWEDSGKSGMYTLVRRDNDGALALVPYHVEYAAELADAAEALGSAAALSDEPEFANYLRLRAEALTTDDYQPSDIAWMDMKNNAFDVVIGAIETYEDQRYGYRAAYEAYVLRKDTRWSAELARFAAFLPSLQEGLPVAKAYRSEIPGSDSDLNAYDVLYYAGHSNAGSKTIAINLPNDEEVQLSKGTRRLQLKNAMRAKFEKILVPISEHLIVPEQRSHVTFDAFFANTMFHEVAHGLGIKQTINQEGSVRQALREYASSMEEGKADVLGLYMITALYGRGELGDIDLRDYYVTFLASIFRSTRFGASSAHGKANMVRFNYFLEQGAFSRNPATGYYRVDMAAMRQAMDDLSENILILQGDGDYAGAKELTDGLGVVNATLQSDLDRLAAAGIPVDIVFRQGAETLGLEK